jgi:hypothetical protein
MSACAGIKRDGGRCTLPADASSGMCWLHDPARAQARHRHASRAAKSKGNKEVATLKEEIKGVIADVKAGDLDRNDAAVMIQAYRALLEFIKLARAVVLEDDLAARIEELQRGQRPHAS